MHARGASFEKLLTAMADQVVEFSDDQGETWRPLRRGWSRRDGVVRIVDHEAPLGRYRHYRARPGS